MYNLYSSLSNKLLSFFTSEIFQKSVKQHDSNFSLQLVQEWNLKLINLQLNVIHAKIGVVAGPRSKFLAPLKMLYNFFLGGRIGNGMQWVSWIHIYDLIEAIDFIIENKLQGPVNLTAPNAITNKQM